eukprot:gene8646-biopygen3147
MAFSQDFRLRDAAAAGGGRRRPALRCAALRVPRCAAPCRAAPRCAVSLERGSCIRGGGLPGSLQTGGGSEKMRRTEPI